MKTSWLIVGTVSGIVAAKFVYSLSGPRSLVFGAGFAISELLDPDNPASELE